MNSLTTDTLRQSVRNLFLAEDEESRTESTAIGAELEMVPVRSETGERVFAQDGSPSGSELAVSVAREFGWTEEPMGSDPSCWSFADGRLTFEPGGQIELSSAVFPSASQLLESMKQWMHELRDRAASLGVELQTIGIDPHNPIERVPLQLHRERYEAMTSYFESIGPYGVLMMRQTASLQINVDRGRNPLERWRLLNALAPYLVAIFANSPRYNGAPTGHKSFRAHIWRSLDPRRTGLAYGNDPIAHYLDFALDAPVILVKHGKRHLSFRELLASDDSVTQETWDVHLSTLFPEIRPREYFEIRSIDSIDPEYLAAAVCLVAGVVYANDASLAAADLLGEPDDSLLTRAGVSGLDDTGLRDRASRLVRIALDGCASLGHAYFAQSHLQQAEEFFQRYTLRGLSPADDSWLRRA